MSTLLFEVIIRSWRKFVGTRGAGPTTLLLLEHICICSQRINNPLTDSGCQLRLNNQSTPHLVMGRYLQATYSGTVQLNKLITWDIDNTCAQLRLKQHLRTVYLSAPVKNGLDILTLLPNCA
jgi:hypothetical protein